MHIFTAKKVCGKTKKITIKNLKNLVYTWHSTMSIYQIHYYVIIKNKRYINNILSFQIVL